MQWHDDTLITCFKSHQGEIVSSTGDGFFVAFASSQEAIACAVAIQRELADHRRTAGFAPMVRIGIHTSEASRHGDNYSGVGVHVASRVAALADGAAIWATSNALEGVDDVSSFELKEVSLKGVAEPIKVASIAWS